MQTELAQVYTEQEEIKLRHGESQDEIRRLKSFNTELQSAAKLVPILKAKNQLDLFDFKIEVIGDCPDDWDEIKRMEA